MLMTQRSLTSSKESVHKYRPLLDNLARCTKTITYEHMTHNLHFCVSSPHIIFLILKLPHAIMSFEGGPCPRCNRGNYPTKRQLLSHLAWCQGPVLFDSFPIGRDNNKRIHDEMTSDPPTNNMLGRFLDKKCLDQHNSGLARIPAFPPLHS